MKKIFLFILLIAPLNAWAVNYCTDPNTAGAWKLDETSGNYTDCTSNGNAGVITGTINQSATLKFGNAASFTNVNNTQIDFGSAAVLDNLFDGGGTFAAWVSADGAGTAGIFCSDGTIFSKGNGDGVSLCLNSTGSVEFTSKWAGGTVTWTSTTNPFSAFDGTAHHILVYYNSDSISNNPTVEVDCSTLTMTQGATAPFGSRNTDAAIDLLFGLDGLGTSTGELNGKIDEAIYYNGDLTGSCSALSTNGIDGTHGSGGSGTVSTGILINGAVLNGFTGN